MSTLERSHVTAIYQDMLARAEMGLLSHGNNEIDVELFCDNLKEAIAEKTGAELPKKVDKFSAVFGMVSERFIREMNRKNGEDW